MSIESVSTSTARIRTDAPRPEGAGVLSRIESPAGSLGVVVLLASVFVLIGGGNLDLGPGEAKLGLASGEAFGPFGQAFGLWEPGLLPGRVVPSQVWAWFHGGAPTAASVRWPEAIAGVLIGLVVAVGAARRFGGRAAMLVALCLFGTVAWIDRSAYGATLLDAIVARMLYEWFGVTALLQKPIAAGIDLLTGLCIVAALERILRTGADRLAGLWGGLAFLSGGWPALVVIALPIIVIGRRGHTLTWRAIWLSLLVVLAWSFWALSTTPAEVWGAALALPLTRNPAWTLPLWVLCYGLPFVPFAALVASRSVRKGWSAENRVWVVSWLQIAGASVLAGTLIPGLADSARIPALVGLAIGAAMALDRLLQGWSELPVGVRRAFFGLCLAICCLWAAVSVPLSGYLAASVSAYRPIAIALVVLGLGSVVLASLTASNGWRWLAFGAVVVVALSAKLSHFGIHAPEWNYRFSQGPWGRAIGQWMPRHSTLYFINPDPSRIQWPPPDLAFHVERRVLLLKGPQELEFEPPPGPHFLLLHPAEYEHWSDFAPTILKVRDLQDQYGNPRVLARTEGPLYADVLDLDPEE